LSSITLLRIFDHFRQAGVTPHFSIIYLLLRSQILFTAPILCGAPLGGESERAFFAFIKLGNRKYTNGIGPGCGRNSTYIG